MCLADQTLLKAIVLSGFVEVLCCFEFGFCRKIYGKCLFKIIFFLDVVPYCHIYTPFRVSGKLGPGQLGPGAHLSGAQLSAP